jgi:hypothetical protein
VLQRVAAERAIGEVRSARSLTLDLFQAAVGHCPASLYEAGMHPHCPAMPWMPGIADFAEIPNMGVVLRSCTTGSETTKVSGTD